MARRILGMRVHPTSYADATARILRWAGDRESRYVCVSNVHMVMESYDDRKFQQIVNDADLVSPDGMPLVWGLRLLGENGATQVCGPELMPYVCGRAAAEGVRVGFYGGTPDVLERMLIRLTRRWPALRVAYVRSPPFRQLSAVEEQEIADEINASGTRVLFVGLGCPKQERWMARQRGTVAAVMVGVGAAFDFVAGAKRRAPPLMREAGLEWCFRLAAEPRRLWKRYLYHNPRFVVLFLIQLLRYTLARRRRAAVQ